MGTEDKRPRLRAEIQRLTGSVPINKFQNWGATTAAAFKAECRKAQQLAARANATEVQLSAQLNEIKRYWQ